MQPTQLLYPIFAQVVLTLVLLATLVVVRVRAIRTGAVRARDIALGQSDPWPAHCQQVARSYQNQFETPMLFYMASLAAIAMHIATLPVVVLAWTWIALRVLHALVHNSTNNVTVRFVFFGSSAATVGALWISVILAAR
jgi:hypothetical protein